LLYVLSVDLHAMRLTPEVILCLKNELGLIRVKLKPLLIGHFLKPLSL
jgi:hypothetical protein